MRKPRGCGVVEGKRKDIKLRSHNPTFAGLHPLQCFYTHDVIVG